MAWKLRRGSDSPPVSFKGLGGQVRSLRVDDLLLSNVEEEVSLAGVTICGQVLCKKAFRGADSLEELTKIEGMLNNGTSLSDAETIMELFRKGKEQ